MELEESLHRVRRRAAVAEGGGRSDRGGQAHQRAAGRLDLYVSAHPGADDRYAGHDSTPSPEGLYLSVSLNYVDVRVIELCRMSEWNEDAPTYLPRAGAHDPSQRK